MQKSYDQMNIHVHHAISDITGKTGMAITDAILAGERDPARFVARQSGLETGDNQDENRCRNETEDDVGRVRCASGCGWAVRGEPAWRENEGDRDE